MYCMSNGIVNELKRVILVYWVDSYIYKMYKKFGIWESLSVDSSEYYVTVAEKPMAL